MPDMRNIDQCQCTPMYDKAQTMGILIFAISSDIISNLWSSYYTRRWQAHLSSKYGVGVWSKDAEGTTCVYFEYAKVIKMSPHAHSDHELPKAAQNCSKITFLLTYKHNDINRFYINAATSNFGVLFLFGDNIFQYEAHIISILFVTASTLQTDRTKPGGIVSIAS